MKKRVCVFLFCFVLSSVVFHLVQEKSFSKSGSLCNLNSVGDWLASFFESQFAKPIMILNT